MTVPSFETMMKPKPRRPATKMRAPSSTTRSSRATRITTSPDEAAIAFGS